MGLIGCGSVARRHAAWLAADPRADVRVCCDPSHAHAEGLQREFFPHATIETEERNAFDLHTELDAVVICSPTLRHHHQVCQALDHGLHVLCEKPLAVARDEVVEICERAKHVGRLVSIAHQRRYKSPYATARRELTENAEFYGPLYAVQLFVCERWQQTIRGTWRDDSAVGAGYFGDAGIHQIDVLHFMTDRRVERLIAASERRGSQVEIATRVIGEMNGGVALTANFVGHAHHYREDIHLHGRDGDLLVRSEELFRCRDNQIERITDLVADSNPDAAFIDAILSGGTTVSPPEIALPIHDWTAAVLKSAVSGEWVQVG
jgi:predicted dehydrogenase